METKCTGHGKDFSSLSGGSEGPLGEYGAFGGGQCQPTLLIQVGGVSGDQFSLVIKVIKNNVSLRTAKFPAGVAIVYLTV